VRSLGFFAFGLVAFACHGAPDPSAPHDTAHPANGHCAASSVVTTTSCPKRTIPPSNKSSDRGCKSDADCKNGIEGRCVDSGFRADRSLRPSGNLLAEPPAAPPPTICVYDQCTTNADCGAHARCQCGSESSRAACVTLDACSADADCGEAMLCVCGTDGLPNGCRAGNCRTDADCPGQKCQGGPSGNFCTTDHDACRERAQCDAPNAYRICDWDRTKKAWGCRDVPPIPPG
jgi:hypothetical protein